MEQGIQAVLLAGGESTRFWPLVDKVTMDFLGKPLLLWHLDQLGRIGVSHTIIAANTKNKEEVEQLTHRLGIDTSVVVQKGAGQGQAILAAKHILNSLPVMVLNASDVYDDSILRDLLSSVRENAKSVYMCAVRRSSYFPGGYLKVTKNGEVEEIVEKPTPGKQPSDFVRIVADLFPSGAALVEAVEHYGNDPVTGYESAVNMLIRKGFPCHMLITKNTWEKLKYPWDVLDVMESYLCGIKSRVIDKTVSLGNGVILEGPMVLEEGVRILEHTKIVGPCYIGKKTLVGNNNMIRESHIGSGCVTGFGTDIARSYIGNDCWFHGNYVGDSVLDYNVSMGSGAVLANLRLDEANISSTVGNEKVNTDRNKFGAVVGRNVRIGVNASIMPGVKIGSNSLVGAGVVLDKDLLESTFCAISGGYTVSKNQYVQSKSDRGQFRKLLKR